MFDYRQKVTRSFEHLQGDYYIAPTFMVILSVLLRSALVCFIVVDSFLFSIAVQFNFVQSSALVFEIFNSCS